MALHAAALAQLDGHRGGPALKADLPTRSHLEAALAATAGDAGRAVFVAPANGPAVAVACACVRAHGADSAADGTGVLELLYVEPAARRRGAATALLAAAEAWAMARGSERLDAVALPGDRALKSFLEAAGLRARLLVLSRPVPEAVTPGPGD